VISEKELEADQAPARLKRSLLGLGPGQRVGIWNPYTRMGGWGQRNWGTRNRSLPDFIL